MANWWDSPASQTTAPVAPNPVTPAPDNNLLTYYQRQMAARPKWTPSDAPYSLSAPSLALSAPPDTQAPTAPEAKAPEAPGVLGSTWNALKGAGVEALKTTQSVGPALYGLADTATGGYLDIGRRRLQAGIQNALGDDTRWQDIDPMAVSQQRTGAMQDELKPDQYRQWEQDVAQQQGAWDKTKATLSHPGLMVGKVAGLAPYLLGGELGLGAKATTAGFGALMGGQSALDAQARVYDKPLEDLQKLPDYRPDQSEADNRARLAQQAARPAAALGAAAGVIPGAIAGKALHGPVTALLGGAEKVAASLPRTMAQGVLQQAPEFAAMNAGTTLAGNVGLRAVDPNQPLMENVPETVAEGLLVGGLSGMAVHPVMSRYQGNKGAKAYTAVLDQVHENRAAVPDTDLAKYVANGQELLSKTPMGKTPRADLLDAVTRTQQIIVDRQAAALAQREAAIADYVKRQAPPIPPEATLDPTADPYGAMIQEAAQRDDLWNEQRESLKRNVAHLEQLKQLRVEQDQRAQESARLEAARKVGEAQRQATTPTIPEGYDPTLDTVGRLPTSTLPPGYDPNPSASMGALGQLGPTRLGASQEPSPLVGLLGVKPPDAVRPPVAALEQNPLDLLRQTARPDVVASAPIASEGRLPNGPQDLNRLLLGDAPEPVKPPVSEVVSQTPDELLNRPARIQPREGNPNAAQSENAARPADEDQSVSAAADHGNADAANEGRADEVRPAESAAGQGQERPAGQEQGQEQEVAPTPPIAADSSTPPEISHDQRSQGQQAQAETETETLLNQQPVAPTVPPKESLVGLSYEQLAKLKSEFDAFLDQYGDQHSWVQSADGKMRETIISNRNIWADYGHALTKALNSAPRPPQAEPPYRQPVPPDPRTAAIDERVNRQIAERQQQVDTIKAATLEKMRALKLEAQRRQQAGEDPQTIVADLGPALTTGKQVLDWLEQRAFEARDQRGYSVNLRAQGATLNKIPDWITRHVESVESKESAPPQEGAGKSPATTTKPRQSYADKVALRETDDLLTAIAKLGGIDQASAKREGIDPSEFKRMPVFGKPLFRKKGGRGLDTMAEVLSEAGYPVLDENGYYTVNRLLDQLDAALRGEQIYTPKGYEDMVRREAEDRQRQQEADDWALDDVELEASGFNGLADSEQAIADWKVNARKQLGVDKADALFERIAEKSNADSESEFLQELNDAYSREMENGGGGRGSSVRNAPEESGRAATGESPEDFSLSGYSQANLNARAAEIARAQAEQAAKDKAANQKAAADRARDDFTLSGSNRPADIAIAAGQKQMFAATTPLSLTAQLKTLSSDATVQALINNGRLKLVAKQSELPRSARIPPSQRVAGWVDPQTGVVYLVTDNITQAEVDGMLSHEIGVHQSQLGLNQPKPRALRLAHALVRLLGGRAILGDPAFEQVLKQMEQLRAAGNVRVVAAFEEAQKAAGKLNQSPALLQEEALAYLVQNQPQLPLVRRIMAAIRATLYRMGLKISLTDADLRYLAQSAVRRAAAERAMLEARGERDVRFAVAWHGTPHTFEAENDAPLGKFRMDKLGTGEGAQVFGHGLYFTEKRKIGEGYRDGLSATAPAAYEWRGHRYEDGPIKHALSLIYNDGLPYTRKLAKQWANDAANNADEKAYFQTLLDTVNNVGSKSEIRQHKGRLYQVHLKPADDAWLLWDKPITAQSKRVKAAIEGNATLKSLAAERKEDGSQKTGEDLYRELSSKQGGDQAASDYLATADIPGMKYLTGDSRAKGKGDYNYVVFRDGDVEVMQRFALARPQPAHGTPPRLAQAVADRVAARLPESAKEFGRRILEEAQLWAAPMAAGTARTQAPAKDYANGVRQTWYEATKTLERLTKDFTPKQHKAMWNGMDATSVWVQQAMNGGMDRDAAMRAAQAQRVGVFALPAAQRDAALALSTRADALWKRAKDAGMVQDDAQGLPFWTPRVAAIIGEDGSFGKPPGKNEGVQNPDHPGIGFTTTSPNLKHRGHVFAADSEAGMQKLFGDKAALVRDIRVMPLAMARLEQAIAGRELINQVKAIGKAIGAEVTSPSPKRGYFTLDHPAFQTFVPRIERQANGAWEQVQETVTDADGHTTLRPAFEKQPLYIAKEFEGPLRAVLNTRSGAIYQGLMGLKRGAMSLVMFSPMIHNAVIWGKAFPAMPGKMITGQIYFEGNRAKRDPSLMKEAIGNGLTPINSGAFHPDVPTGLNSLSGHDAGLISTALSKGVGLVNKSAGAALAKGLDQLGGFWHNTMLWDRIADLQMGLYVNLKQHQMDKGLDAQSAGRVAAHFANRYAGAIPQEAMGEGARRLGNLALFSRSFTLGNLAIMKDMLTGLPQDVKAQILRDAGQGAMDQATAAARKKAWVMLAADIGLMYVGNAMLQGAVDKLKLDKSLDEIGQGYARRLDKALKAADGNPLQLVNPWSAAFLPDRLSPGSEHEPGKEDRIFTGRDPRTGTASYTRLPTGKVGEELLRWPTRPLEMLRKKQSTLLRPTMEIFANRDHFNNPVYDADAPGLDGMVQRVGQVVGHFLSGQAPVEEAGAAYRSLTGQAVTGDTLKWAGPLMGFTAGRGYPGGPELGAIATAERRHADEIKAMRPEIKRLVDGGQVQEAVRKMTQLGMSPTAQRALIVSVVAPQSRLNSGALMRFYRNATVEEKAKLQDVIDAR